MMPQKQNAPGAEHRQREGQRVKDVPILAAKYPQLKSLPAELTDCDHEKVARRTTM